MELRVVVDGRHGHLDAARVPRNRALLLGRIREAHRAAAALGDGCDGVAPRRLGRGLEALAPDPFRDGRERRRAVEGVDGDLAAVFAGAPGRRAVEAFVAGPALVADVAALAELVGPRRERGVVDVRPPPRVRRHGARRPVGQHLDGRVALVGADVQEGRRARELALRERQERVVRAIVERRAGQQLRPVLDARVGRPRERCGPEQRARRSPSAASGRRSQHCFLGLPRF